MIKVSYDAPLKRDSIVLFNIDGVRIIAEISESVSSGNFYLWFEGSNLISLIEKEIKMNIKDFFSKILGTDKRKYRGQYWPEESLENLMAILEALEKGSISTTVNTKKGIQYSKPLEKDDRVKIITTDVTYEAKVCSNRANHYYLWLLVEGGNSKPLINSIANSLCGKDINSIYAEAGAKVVDNGIWPYSTLKDLEKVLDYINKECGFTTPIINPIKQQQNGNEIKLQRTEGVIREGTVPEGCGICSKINTATISSRPLKNTAISG